MSGLLHACIFLEINCTFLMLFVVFLSYTSVLFFLSRARKQKNDDNKVEVYDEPDPVSKEQTVLWLMDVFC